MLAPSGAFLIAAFGVEAQSVSESLAGCAAVADDGERLACFDALAGRVAAEPPAPPVPVAANPAPVTAPDESQARVGEDAFGLMEEVAAREPERIESRLVGEFHGWHAGQRFQLENGQVWQQTDKVTARYTATNPAVTIRKTALGAYRMKLEGVNRRVRVRRIE